MAGEANARGWGTFAGTDQVRNLPAELNAILDQIAAATPYQGTVTATTDANGVVVVTHGLGFTPSRVFAQSSVGHISMLIDTRTSTTFRTKWGAQSGTTLIAANAVSTTFYWIAFR
jgi:hypothetical protein